MIQIYFITYNPIQASEIAQALVKNKLAVAVRVDENQPYYFFDENQNVTERKVFFGHGLNQSIAVQRLS